MYPAIRMVKELLIFRRRPLGLSEVHVSTHRCWPWDLDLWAELNNGRTLTLYDLGRVPLCLRLGITGALTANRWGMTVAGSSVRYRRRVRLLQRVTMRSRLLGWDARFLYFEQSMWRGGEALNQALIRVAATEAAGILPPAQLLAAMGHDGRPSPALPGWVQAWVAAEAQRPWPPMAG